MIAAAIRFRHFRRYCRLAPLFAFCCYAFDGQFRHARHFRAATLRLLRRRHSAFAVFDFFALYADGHILMPPFAAAGDDISPPFSDEAAFAALIAFH